MGECEVRVSSAAAALRQAALSHPLAAINICEKERRVITCLKVCFILGSIGDSRWSIELKQF
jgi:hypothetical protein